MKGSDQFKTAIENYLNQTAQSDGDFAQHYAKESKNLESCINYIFGEVKKTGLCAFDNQEIFDMAVKYYTDDTIGKPLPVSGRAVVRQSAEHDLFTAAPEVPQDASVKEKISVAQDSLVAQGISADENSAALQNTSPEQTAAAVQNTAVPKKVAHASKKQPQTLTLFDL
ncbi:Cas9 inhibitor AcrIIA9 family protein [Flavobacterium sp. ACN6]|uniref:PcfK-like family protein n=1 Tax=Flavobacterium sp. ACN6 TaxID=1920426 RepID=UPI000BB38926|nr:Cas9 inhibitor AcrIIA9 family protein [Flavobacterium sp. ACN6]PBJ08052.1 hypothetical protein BSF42_37690 [Flavobacterium sp. ACN6]